MISPEEKERVRQATDIVSLVGETVMLRQRGQEFWGHCPFHNDKSPSFHVIPATGVFKCFGCQAGGDVFAYVMKRDNVEFPDAVRYLAERAGIELNEEASISKGPRKNRLLEALAEAETYYHTLLLRGKSSGAAQARSYLSGRSMGIELCKSWKLGYAPGNNMLVNHLRSKGFTNSEIESANLAYQRNGKLQDRFFNRVMFPIHDERGKTIAFGGRVMGDGQPKYLNSSENTVFHKSKALFAFDRAKDMITAKGEALIVEGYTDVIALHEAGFTNAVATLGTALTLDHIKLLSRYKVSRIVFMFDGDEAGQRAAERAVQFIDKCDAQLVCVVLPGGLDPAEFLATHSADELQQFLSGAQPLMDFVFEKRMASYSIDSPGRRVSVLDEMASVLAPLKHSVLIDEYATRLADMLGLSMDSVKKKIVEKPIIHEDYQQKTALITKGSSEATADRKPSFTLNSEARTQAEIECELLAAISVAPDFMRKYKDRIASLSWTDSRFEAMAWAMLATEPGTSTQNVVGAAISVVEDAPEILAMARRVSPGAPDFAKQAQLIVDSAEYLSIKRKIAAIRSELQHGGKDKNESELFSQATELQKRLTELSQLLSSPQSS